MAEDANPAGDTAAPNQAPEQTGPSDALKNELAGLQTEMKRAMASGNSREARRLSERAAKLRSGEVKSGAGPSPGQAASIEGHTAYRQDVETVRPRSEQEVQAQAEIVDKAVEAGLLVRDHNGAIDRGKSFEALSGGALKDAELREMQQPFDVVDKELSRSPDREAALAKSERQVVSSIYGGNEKALQSAVAEVNEALDLLPHGGHIRHWLDAGGYLADPRTHRLVVGKARELLAQRGKGGSK